MFLVKQHHQLFFWLVQMLYIKTVPGGKSRVFLLVARYHQVVNLLVNIYNRHYT